MPMRYKVDLLAVLKEAGYNTNRIRKEKIMGEAMLQKIRNGQMVSWAVCDIVKQKRRQPLCVKQNGCRLSFYLPIFENVIHRQINGGFHTLADGIKYDFLQRALLGVFILLLLLFLTALGIIYSHFSLTSVVIFTSEISVLLR